MPLLRLNDPLVQNILAGVILGLGPGIYVAITLLGAGGGRANETTEVNIANSVLYAVWFCTGWFSGSVVTTIGPKFTLMLGTLGYPIFVGGLWYFTASGHDWYPIFGGAFLGLTANLIWTAAGYIAFSYSTEQRRGSFISMQWGILSVISTLASLVAFVINLHASVLQVPLAVYITYVCFMALGFFVALFAIVSPSKVRRSDGTALAHYPHKGFWFELKAQRQLFTDWRLFALFIPMFASEVATIVISTLNSLYFNIRTRSLNSLMFNVMQIFASLGIAFLLDSEKIGSRRTRGFVSTAVVSVIIIAGWIGLTVWLYKNPLDLLSPPEYDWTDGPFGGFFVLNLIFGMNVVIYQVLVQWILSSLTNDPEQLARFAGLAKGVLAGGEATSFGTDAAGLTQLRVVAYNFTLQAFGLICMGIVSWKCVTTTNYRLESSVIPPLQLEAQEKSETSNEVEAGSTEEQEKGR